MIYIKYSSPDVSLNLAAEYYFATEKTFDEDVFTLWQPRPTVVVGTFQNIHEEVDTAYAASRGIDIVRRLSGGNVQKILVGREIASSPTVLMAAYPVRGLDINSSYTIYNLLNKQKEKEVMSV